MTCEIDPSDDPANYTYENCYPPSPALREYLEERDKEAKTAERAAAEAKKARQAESVKRAKAKYYAMEHNEKNKEYYQNYRYEKKLKEVTQKLESLGIEKIAEIVIANKKHKMFYDSFY